MMESRDSEAEFYDSRTTFSQARLTMSNLARKTVGLSVDVDDEWTKNILEDYNKAKVKGNIHTQMPQPASFFRDRNFWKAFFLLCVIGFVLGLTTLGFMNFTDKIPKVWVNGGPTSSQDDYFLCGSCYNNVNCSCTKYENCQWYGGQLYWMGITTITGFVVGVLRFACQYPEDLPGLFQEINTCHVEPKWAPATILISAISLAGGASLGPEQGLGNLGGGITTGLLQKFKIFDENDEEENEYRKLCILSGMASSLGALFPTPLLGVLMIHELGSPPRTYMESTLLLSCGACVAFVVYIAIINDTFIDSISSNGEFVAYNWDFNAWNCMTAIVIGLASACFCLVLLFFIGISRQVFNRIRLRLHRFKFLAAVLPPMIGGVCIGAVNWALPLTIGNGNQVLVAVIKYGGEGHLSKQLLMNSAVAKAFVLAISMNCGFIGGFIYPIITISIMIAAAASQMYPGLPFGLLVSCFMAGFPGAIIPMPFTLCGIAIFTFYFGLYQTAPIFIACITSYSFIVGSGIFNELQKRGGKAQDEKNEKQDGSESDSKTDAVASKPSAPNTTHATMTKKEKEQAQTDLDTAKEIYIQSTQSPFSLSHDGGDL